MADNLKSKSTGDLCRTVVTMYLCCLIDSSPLSCTARRPSPSLMIYEEGQAGTAQVQDQVSSFKSVCPSTLRTATVMTAILKQWQILIRLHYLGPCRPSRRRPCPTSIRWNRRWPRTSPRRRARCSVAAMIPERSKGRQNEF